MTRAYALPVPVALVLQQRYLPNVTKVSTLVRLYFGKTLNDPGIGKLPRFFNTDNFPVDAARYEYLYGESPSGMYPAGKVVREMGDIRARIHFRAGYNGRDIEFWVGLQHYVIDFNQMRPWDKMVGDVGKIVSSFFQNDPYYPHPRQADPLYQDFRSGYLARAEDAGVAKAFFQEIEKIQAERDARVEVADSPPVAE